MSHQNSVTENSLDAIEVSCVKFRGGEHISVPLTAITSVLNCKFSWFKWLITVAS